MLIGVKKRFVFIANSKTGSTSIEAVLARHAEINRSGSAGRKHIGWSEVRQEYAFLFDNSRYAPETFFRFGVVREPADWVLSWYNYRRFTKEAHISAGVTFEAFWDGGDWLQNKRQKGRFLDDDGVCRFDLIIPLEALRSALPVLFKTLGVKIDKIPVENKSKDSLPRSAIPGALIDRINDYYRDDWLFYIEWKDKFDRVFENTLKKLTLNGSRSASREPADRATQEVVVRKLESDVIQTARLARLPRDVTAGRPFAVNGIVMPKPDYAADGLRLVVSGDRGEREASWGLPSPHLAGRFPNNPRAASARFKIDEVRLENGKPVEICLDDVNGKRHVLFKLEFIG